ncbi:hypothetical protein BH11MYX4_BH11MYX4_36620 [soil metagenome]
MKRLDIAPLVLLACVAAACGPSAESTEGIGASSDAFSQGGTEAWGPSLALRDDTATFAGRPAGGWFVTPIHITLLPDGKLLTTGWGRAQLDRCQFPEGSRAHGETFVLDPEGIAARATAGTLGITPINELVTQDFRLRPGDDPQLWTPEVLYCAGHTPTSGGVLYTGGARYQFLGERNREVEVGISSARIFDYATGGFRKLAATMQGGPISETIESAPSFGPVDKRGWRWYPTNTRMADGRVLVTGGYSSLKRANLSVESFDPASESWKLLAQHDDGSIPAIRETMAPGLKDYTHTFLLPTPVSAQAAGGQTRQVAMMGWNGRVLLMNTDEATPASARFAQRPGSARPNNAQSWDASAAILQTGEIMVVGGTNDPNVAKRVDIYDAQADAWTQSDSGIGRRNSSTILMPDGNVLLMNGWDEDGNLPGDRRRPQVFDPRTRTFQTFAPWTDDPFERGYHSFAILLKDGSVLVGGGTVPLVNGQAISSIGCERTDVRVYRPSYLSKGPRPVFNAPEPINLTIGAGAEASFAFQGAPLAANGGAVLMALPSTTHGFDQNQRYVPLTYRVANGSVFVTAPSNPNVAPPGDYLLFLVSTDGTPSVGKHVRLAKGTEAPPDIKRTVVFMFGKTEVGQDMFIRGGIDHGFAQSHLGRTCTAPNGALPSNYLCAIPMTHRNLRNGTTAPWKTNDRRLDWYGSEPGQSSAAVGTAADWTTDIWPASFGATRTVASDGFGVEPLNHFGQHYWMVDVDMDCSKTVSGWFEIKSFISNGPAWEPDVSQAGTPYTSGNHFAQCGKVNVFKRGDSSAIITPIP